MTVPQPHPRQHDRLQALYAYEVLDTDRETEFDEVTKLAAALCEVPVALISLVDAERQWFKSAEGIDGLAETPINQSICAHAIMADGFTEIPDTLEDPRTRDNALCTGPEGMRFYAGAVLRTVDRLPIGTLCVLDRRPRHLTALQRDALRVLAGQVMARLELRRALALAGTLHREIDHRVKNSLQSISSLARIEARSAANPEAREALLAIDRRISAVAEVHEHLHRTAAGSNVDLAQYVQLLVGRLRDVLPDRITVEADIAAVKVSSRQAAALGMLVNEFAANAVKHAFPDGRAGRVSFTGTLLPDERMTFTCADNGVGLPANTAQTEAEGGLGMKIAEAVSMQLGTEIEVLREAGLTLALTFLPELRTGAIGP